MTKTFFSMPQFDFTTYSSQIFWFSICFALLYFFASKIILPRIQKIIEERKTLIDSNLLAAKDLDCKIESIKTRTALLRQEASTAYSSKLEEVTKNAAKQRDKMVEELKEKLETKTQKSRQELRSFVEQSKAKSESTIAATVQTIYDKIFGKI
jgi:F-type H+-transporting ATPase subunit b